MSPAGNCMFKVNNRNTRTRCEICSKLTIKIPERIFPITFNPNATVEFTISLILEAVVCLRPAILLKRDSYTVAFL